MSYHKARDSKLDPFHNLDKENIEKKGWPLHTKHIAFGIMYAVCKIMASDASQPEKLIITRSTRPLDPLSYQSNLFTRPHLWQISGGGGVRNSAPPPPPLWIRACFTWNVKSVIYSTCKLQKKFQSFVVISLSCIEE